ncbi:MAG: hypothetical protein V7641_672 [Blastocatellia bacterium]
MVMQVQKEIDKPEQAVSPVAISGRRQARRFGVTWPVVVRGFDQHGEAFQEFCFLKNLSPTGACLGLKRSLDVGATIEMDVRTPLSQKQWLRYFGKVIYVGSQARPQATGIRFDSARPAFVPAAAVVRLRLLKGQSCIVH